MRVSNNTKLGIPQISYLPHGIHFLPILQKNFFILYEIVD